MRIAVVGSGISGLTAAHVLDRRHEVVLLEAGARVGGHTCTVPVEIPGDRSVGVDVGFIVFNDRTYPSFIRLLDALGVASDDTDMSFSLSCERTGLEYDAGSLSGLFAQPRNALRPRFYRMWADAFRFYREARALLAASDGPGAKSTLGEYLDGRRFGEDFVERHLLPMGAAIWSTDVAKMRAFPLATLLRFFDNHGLLSLRDRPQWKVVRGGSSRYVERIVHGLRGQVWSGTPVLSVQRTPRAVEITTPRGVERFDQVVLATHAGQALRMLEAPSDAERAVLGRIRTQPNELVLHTDASVLPRARRAWASWNYRLSADADAPVSLTYHMNRLQHIEAPVELCATLNPCRPVAPEHTIRRFSFAHPVFDAAALEAQGERDAICGVDRIHYCGAWWGYGFHEDGVRSALAVTRRFGLEL